MQFSPGDKIRFLDEQGGGVVKKIISKTSAEIFTWDGFTIPYLISKLVLVEKAPEPLKPTLSAKQEAKILSPDEVMRMIQEKYQAEKKPVISKKHAKNSGVLEKEVDLHIEEIRDYPGKLSNGEKLNIQLSYFKQELDSAITNNLMKVVFIHGVGNGVLKHEIVKILKEYKGLRYFDAPYNRYGFGATQVEFFH